ncbi:MAG: CpsD/CapB family tyrosine-protein kinase [Vicinamibacterales bacterium]
MTRLSEALQRAAQTSGSAVGLSDHPAAAPWEFTAAEPAPERPVERSAERSLEPTSAPTSPPSSTLASRFSTEERFKVVVGTGADTALVEQYRHLAAMLHHAQGESGIRSVMITSALASEGKTLTAANLAMTLSESYQRRVLLIDADLRRPRIAEMFALPAGEGLTDSLVATGGRQLPVHQVSPTLWVLTAGRALPDPMSTLVSPAMKQLLDEARDAFDWVVVDTPPVAILPDAHLLASMIDTALLVVSARSTPYPMVRRAVDAIGAPRILGAVLNRADKANLSAGYGYYGAKRASRV